MVNPITALPIPAGYGLVCTDEVGRREIAFPVVVEVVNKPINKQPPVRLCTHVFRANIWLPAEVNGQHYGVEAVPKHISLANGRSRLVFRRGRIPRAENPNRVTKIKTPKNLSTSPGVVAALVFERRFSVP
jgi:hypothetical protein